MSDLDDLDNLPPAPLAEVSPEGPSSEVAYVVPPAAYDSIDTDDELARLDRTPEANAPDGSARVLDALAALGAALAGRLDTLETRFEREGRAEASREKVVDRLHAELQEYKQGLLLSVMRPVFVDLIQLHDDMGKTVEAHPDAEGALAHLRAHLDGFRQGIEDILYRQGVEPFQVEGDLFDPRRQRAVSTVPTDDPTPNKRIAARLRTGFQAGDKVIRPEIVSVHAARK